MGTKIKLTTPVLFLVFNRFDTTKKVFTEIRKAKPDKLFIASDGPRNNKPGEREKVEEIRKYILNNVDWPCKIKTLFRDKNLGCKYAVSGAIDWFFENVEQGIILEDDCLPNQSFFRFCQEMLEKYKDDKKIMQISGTNVEEISDIEEDYFFAPCFNPWGWATWKRAWEDYDVEMKDWPSWRIKLLQKINFYTLIDKIKTIRLYELVYRGEIDTWDYQWNYSCVKKEGLTVLPSFNLITNLGFENATHTNNYSKSEKTLNRFKINFPLKKPIEVQTRLSYYSSFKNFFKR